MRRDLQGLQRCLHPTPRSLGSAGLRSGKAGRSNAGEGSEEWKEKQFHVVLPWCAICWDTGTGILAGICTKRNQKGIGVSSQHVLDFPLIPWHRNSNPALLWGRKIPFPSPLAGILQIGDKPSDSRRLLGWEEAQGCAQTSQGMAPAPCLQQPVAILISMENQPEPSQLSWRFSDVPVMFKSILCLISL